MNRKRIILIVLSIILIIGLISEFLIPKNTPIISHFLNKNSLDIEVVDDLNEERIKIKLSIWGTDFEDITIVDSESINSIPKGYGENDWFLSYDDKNFGVFRHFKTNNWHDHNYSLKFYKENGEVLCDVQIDGPDQMDKRTIRLDKKIKTDIDSESGLGIKRKWQLKDGWFPEQNLEFVATNENNSNYAFRFEENGELKYLGSLEGMTCVVGEFTMKDGNWKIQNNLLTLELRGLKISDYWYWWIIEYELTFKGDRMILKVNKIIKNREISSTKTWGELINE